MPRRNDIINEQVYDFYFKLGLNRRQTAEKLNCSEDLVAYRLKKMGLKPKNMSDCVEAGKKRSTVLSKELVEIIDGEMLGDGGLIVYKNQGSFRESVGFDKKNWAIYLMDLFRNNSVPIVGDKLYRRKPCGKSNNHTWSFATLNTMELGNIYRVWYKINKDFNIKKPMGFSNRKFIKIVPQNLHLTPKALLHWYIGDGSINKVGGGCVLHTEGFTYNETEFLRYRLKKDLGILSVHYNESIIGISRKEREKLLNIIGFCPVKCYEYKWFVPNTKNRKSRKINDFIDMKVVESYLKGV